MFKKIISIFFSILLVISAGCDKGIDKEIERTPQNVLLLVSHRYDYLLPELEILQPLFKADYLAKYYLPWENPEKIASFEGLKEVQNKIINDYIQKPGWGVNKKPLPKSFFTNIQSQMDLDSFPNQKQKAITINKTYMRVLPTEKPSFTNWTDPGEGYPFDNLQSSYLDANQPVYIYQETRDGEWSLVATKNYSVGWVKSKDLALVDDSFIQSWKTANQVVALTDNDRMNDDQGKQIFLTKIGQIFPLINEVKDDYQVLTAKRDIHGKAVLSVGFLPKAAAANFPLLATPTNIATMANKFLRTPYGWGGLYGYRDCSLTLADLFANFGLYLPRNSQGQSKMGTVISFDKLNNSEKRKLIISKGIPFYTFINIPGHIMLYVGHHKDTIYVFHSPWGLHTESPATKEEGRIIIGRAIVAPIELGKGYGVKTALDSAIGMTILLPSY